jgi:hypothetical protein
MPNKVVARANDAFDAATSGGWNGVEVHIEAPAVTRAEVLARWSQPGRIPGLRDMSSGAVGRIRVHCSDGVVDLPIPGRDMPVPPAGTPRPPAPPPEAPPEPAPTGGPRAVPPGGGRPGIAPPGGDGRERPPDGGTPPPGEE